MGGSNPVSQVAKIVSEPFRQTTLNPIKEISKAIGADGVAAMTEGAIAGTKHLDQQVGDFITGEGGKREAKFQAQKAEEGRQAGERAAAEAKKREEESNAEIEKDRMAAGSKSRTLLTGPKGLEDETDAQGRPITISRRTLRGR